MLVSANRLIGTKILSMQTAGAIATISAPIVDPNTFKIIAFYVEGGLINNTNNILDTISIREYSRYGCVVDSIDELVSKDDLIGLKVETKKGTNLGKIIDYTVTSEDFTIQQIIVKRPFIKSFSDPELTIPRKEIVEVTDYKVIVKDEEKVIKKKAAHEDFIPNFVNPFRKSEQDYVPSHTKTPADKDIE